MNVVAMIPGRMGSERLPIKNLALLDGRPLISYALEAAKESGIFTKIVRGWCITGQNDNIFTRLPIFDLNTVLICPQPNKNRRTRYCNNCQY